MTRIQEILKADARYKQAMAELERIKNIEDEKLREKGIQEASRLIVDAAYNRAEVYELLGFVLIQSADKLLRTSADLLGMVQKKVTFNDKFKLGQAMDALNKIIKTLDHESCKIHKEYHLHSEVEDSDLTPFDAINKNSDVMLCFNMLVYNALKKSKGNAKILEKYLRKLKGEGEDIFTLEEINEL